MKLFENMKNIKLLFGESDYSGMGIEQFFLLLGGIILLSIYRVSPIGLGEGGGLNFVKRDEIQQKGEFNILGMSGESPPQSLPWLQILISHIMNPLRSVLGLITVIILKRVTE